MICPFCSGAPSGVGATYTLAFARTVVRRLAESGCGIEKGALQALRHPVAGTEAVSGIFIVTRP